MNPIIKPPKRQVFTFLAWCASIKL